MSGIGWCRFESCQIHQYGAMVKWLRHRPFTVVVWVRSPLASPIIYAQMAELADALVSGTSMLKGMIEGSTPSLCTRVDVPSGEGSGL